MKTQLRAPSPTNPRVLPPSREHPFGYVTEEGLRDIGRTAFGLTYPEDRRDAPSDDAAPARPAPATAAR